jgi:hypothetical protein
VTLDPHEEAGYDEEDVESMLRAWFDSEGPTPTEPEEEPPFPTEYSPPPWIMVNAAEAEIILRALAVYRTTGEAEGGLAGALHHRLTRLIGGSP